MPIDNEKQDQKIAGEIHNLFQRIRSAETDLDPYLETRVLALWRERKEKKGLRFWKRTAVATTALSLMLVVGLSLQLLRTGYAEAYVGEPFSVHLGVKDLKEFSIAKARIILPEGVSFETDDLPEVSRSREITLAWNNRGETHFIPFLLKSSATGLKTVTIKFLTDKDAFVAERKLTIKLVASKPEAKLKGEI